MASSQRSNEIDTTHTLFPFSTHTVQTGDLFQLGEHLLLCGDATKKEDIQRLYQHVGTRMACCLTDPPYGELAVSWDIPTFAFIPHLKDILVETATCLLFCSLPFGFDLQQAMTANGWKFRFDTVWHKGNAGFQVSKQMPLVAHENMFVYQRGEDFSFGVEEGHERIFAYARRGTPASLLTFNGHEAGETLESWGDRASSTGSSNQAYAKGIGSNRTGREDGARWIRSVLSGRKKQERPRGERTEHPNQKDPEQFKKLVVLLTNPGEWVYDCFLGSGTTLLACEMSGRRCAAIEQSPEYCTDALRLWQQLTNREPVLLERLSS